jgi:hypothetical protein
MLGQLVVVAVFLALAALVIAWLRAEWEEDHPMPSFSIPVGAGLPGTDGGKAEGGQDPDEQQNDTGGTGGEEEEIQPPPPAEYTLMLLPDVGFDPASLELRAADTLVIQSESEVDWKCGLYEPLAEGETFAPYESDVVRVVGTVREGAPLSTVVDVPPNADPYVLSCWYEEADAKTVDLLVVG